MVFTDYICRVNSNGVRKVRVIVVTGSSKLPENNILILVPEKSFEVKLALPLIDILKLTIHADNPTNFMLSSVKSKE